MKQLILVFAMLASSFSFAGVERIATNAEKKAVLKTVMNDVMLRGAIAEARKSGICRGTVLSAVTDDSSGVEFEAVISCSALPNQEDGLEVFLTINVKGRVFGDFLENSVIKVNKVIVQANEFRAGRP